MSLCVQRSNSGILGSFVCNKHVNEMNDRRCACCVAKLYGVGCMICKVNDIMSKLKIMSEYDKSDAMKLEDKQNVKKEYLRMKSCVAMCLM